MGDYDWGLFTNAKARKNVELGYGLVGKDTYLYAAQLNCHTLKCPKKQIKAPIPYPDRQKK